MNKIYYVIWRGKKAGFFSIIAGIIGHIKIALENGYEPVVDLMNYKCIYSEKHAVNGSQNVFNYYFEPFWSESLKDIYKKNNNILSEGKYPHNFTMSVSKDFSLLQIWIRYFKLKPIVQERLDESLASLNINNRTLGVHMRGQELRRARSHPMPMSLNQAKFFISKELASGKFDKVFVVTEGANYLNHLKKAFPGKILHTDSFRTFFVNSFWIYPRHNHFYKLGLEILVDMIILSKCGGLLSASSNVSEMAILVNNKLYKRNIQVRNGNNSKSILYSKIKWYLKAMAPQKFWGFKKSNYSW
jgi:hypothetical protein